MPDAGKSRNDDWSAFPGREALPSNLKPAVQWSSCSMPPSSNQAISWTEQFGAE